MTPHHPTVRAHRERVQAMQKNHAFAAKMEPKLEAGHKAAGITRAGKVLTAQSVDVPEKKAT